MIKKVLEISNAQTYLSVSDNQLVLKRDRRELSRIPCEDIGVLIVDHPATIYTHTVFTRLLEYGAAVVLCNGTHHPAGMLLPLQSNCIQSERFRSQVQSPQPLKKRLWKQIVQAKISHQAKVVSDDSAASKALKILKTKVRSGDTANVEARASKLYWKSFLSGTAFTRDINGPCPNNLLNYGYMVLRAAVARAICAAGLLPTLGLHHCNRYNAFCLADDMIEPFRGYVDQAVREICREYNSLDLIPELDRNLKARLLEVLYQPIVVADQEGPLIVAMHRTMASLEKCFEKTQQKLDLPKL